MKTLILDNYDSYTYNLYQLIAKVTGEKPIVIKNDELSYEEIEDLEFDNILISPGPGSPDNIKDFGVCGDIIKNMNKPILGVCLGHQGICHFYNGKVDIAPESMHGRISKIYHNGEGIFKGIKDGFKATRYHSLIAVDKEMKDLEVTARTNDGIIMGIKHRNKPIYGVQFHPESIGTESGEMIIENFMNISEEYNNFGNKLKYIKFSSQKDGKEVFKKLYIEDKKTLWLDSSRAEKGLSRFSIFGMSSKKRGYVLKYNVDTKIVEKIYDNGKIERYDKNIFDYLKEKRKKCPLIEEIPCDFQLGLIGYFGYELKADTITNNRYSNSYPDAYLRYCDRAVIIDHEEDEIYILAMEDDNEWMQKVEKIINSDYTVENAKNIHCKKYPKMNFVKNKSKYIDEIKKIQELIKQGETYEVCLTNRLDIHDNIDAVDYYMNLRKVSPGQYSALLNFDEVSIASSSMEKFLTVDRDNRVVTKPIKGTIKRGENSFEDQKLIEELRTEEKTMAENLMIVDLLRNDFGKVCEIGTVEVPKLMDVETYKTLHQLVTTVSGKIDKEVDVMDVLKATFPGGSMTGAPKKRTLEIIDEFENVPRGIYSGSIGYISNNSTMDLSIVIRTAIIEPEITTVGVGGAILNLSLPEEEFEEIILKAKGVLLACQLYYKGNTEEKIDIEF